MTAKKYLTQARTIQIRLETMQEQLEILRSAAMCVTTNFNNTGVSGTRNFHKNEDAIIRTLEKEEQIKFAQSQLVEIMATIDSVTNPDGQAVLVKRYLCNIASLADI